MPKHRFWEEIEPLVKHGAAAATLFLISAGLARLGEWTSSDTDSLTLIKTIEHYSGITIFVLFSTNTMAILAIRMFSGLRREIKESSKENA